MPLFFVMRANCAVQILRCVLVYYVVAYML